jgi:hypothetical protein
VAALLTLVIVYCSWRAGLQIIAGLDPAFTADAWGGPSYLGALYCHYLDAALIVAVASLGLNGVLPRAVEPAG